MKAIALAALVLVGCGDIVGSVDSRMIKRAESLCVTHGGIDELHAEGAIKRDIDRIKVRCKDGTFIHAPMTAA